MSFLESHVSWLGHSNCYYVIDKLSNTSTQCVAKGLNKHLVFFIAEVKDKAYRRYPWLETWKILFKFRLDKLSSVVIPWIIASYNCEKKNADTTYVWLEIDFNEFGIQFTF